MNSKVSKTVFPVLVAISLSHMINDLLQAVVPSVYPIIKDRFHLTFAEIGLITLTYQTTASLLQPVVGFMTDRKPRPYSLVIGMTFTLAGILSVSRATSFYSLLLSVAMVGIGSSIFHPESSRVAHLASGGRKGLAQSIFQLGGNTGSALGPLLAALIVVPYGQKNIAWFGIAALLGITILYRIATWYMQHINERLAGKAAAGHEKPHNLSRKKIAFSLLILLTLIFSKYFYMASMTSYYTFFLISKFHVSVQQAQSYLFLFLASVALGTLLGGSVGDLFGRKYVIWISILGVAPFTLLLPYASLFWTGVLSVFIGLILASAFSAILVYATELIPGKVGTIAGLFFGLAFGMGGIGSAVLGNLADKTDIEHVYRLCAFLPLIGIVTAFLPTLHHDKKD